VLAKQGWSAPSWPEEYGGTGWTAIQRYIFARECTAVDAPRIFTMGVRMVGPVIMKFGTPEQKAKYLPDIVSGDSVFCQGYSEPGSGSDLASLKTRAVRDACFAWSGPRPKASRRTASPLCSSIRWIGRALR